ncbi:MAG: response regulator, partial [Geopsychrobacter sp.]|nr:response regulator [Geopsychrobacter sp.]
TAAGPLAALQLAADYPDKIDLLLTDVIMPDLNGKELATRLSQQRPEIKILYMSGYTADIISKRGLLPEGLNLLQKPFANEELTRKLRDCLDA